MQSTIKVLSLQCTGQLVLVHQLVLNLLLYSAGIWQMLPIWASPHMQPRQHANTSYNSVLHKAS